MVTRVEDLQVLGTRVLIEPDVVEKMESSLIHMPESVKNKAMAEAESGTIVAIGNATSDEWVQVGDWVMYGRYAGGASREIGGKKYIILDEDDILLRERR